MTLTAVPLVTARFPGVMTPVPLTKVPVSEEDAPGRIDVGFATKLAMEGSETGLKLSEFTQPTRPPKLRLNTKTSRVWI